MAKNKLHKLSHYEPSDSEVDAVLKHLEAPDVPDMVAAVLGGSLVEYALEVVLRDKLGQYESDLWERMIDSNGPLRDFRTKILMGLALGLFDEISIPI